MALTVRLPPDESTARDQEQDDRGNDPTAVGLEEIAQLIATQILVDLAHESLADVRGLRQTCLNPLDRGSHAGASLPHPG